LLIYVTTYIIETTKGGDADVNEMVSELVKVVAETLTAEALKLLVDALKEKARQQKASEEHQTKGKHFKRP
jgi:hypothetical protein